MKVILLENVENLGEKYDVKEVKDGYARNFLIPKGLVKPATQSNLKWLETQVEQQAEKAQEELEEIQKVVSAIDGREIEIPVKVGEGDQLYESINEQKIIDVLKKENISIKKSQVKIKEPIKQLGEFPVKISFKHNLEGEIKVIVVPEEKS
jgi:large subunit ribosomal protein L9